MKSDRKRSRSAASTESSPPSEPRKATRRVPSVEPRDAPWIKVMLRRLPPGVSRFQILSRRLGWTTGRIYWAYRTPMLSISDGARLARALGRPIGEFLEELAREQGIPALNERPGERLPQRTSDRDEVKKRQRRSRASVRSGVRDDLALIKARASLNPRTSHRARLELRNREAHEGRKGER